MPDKRGLYPKYYWDRQRSKEYNKSSAIERTQREMTEKALDLFDTEGKKILDIGCGGGFSLQVLVENGFEPYGLDISLPMLKIAQNKGFIKLIRGSFRDLPFKNDSFDKIISISALQWIPATDEQEIYEEYKRVAGEIKRVLNDSGEAVIQFYPETEGELQIAMDQFSNVGFSGGLIVDEEISHQKSDKKYLHLKVDQKS